MKRNTMKKIYISFFGEGKEKIWQMARYKNNAVALAEEVIYLFTHLFPVLTVEKKRKINVGNGSNKS